MVAFDTAVDGHLLEMRDACLAIAGSTADTLTATTVDAQAAEACDGAKLAISTAGDVVVGSFGDPSCSKDDGVEASCNQGCEGDCCGVQCDLRGQVAAVCQPAVVDVTTADAAFEQLLEQHLPMIIAPTDHLAVIAGLFTDPTLVALDVGDCEEQATAAFDVLNPAIQKFETIVSTSASVLQGL